MLTRRQKVVHWIGLSLSLPAACYAALGFVFYVWLGEVESARSTPERAGLLAVVAGAAVIIFFCVFVYCAATLIKDAHERHGGKRGAT